MKRRPSFLKRCIGQRLFSGPLPGFVEGYVYERTDGESRHNIMTSAESGKTRRHFRTPGRNTGEAVKKIGFNPAEIMKNLNVEIERAVYRRSSY